MPEKIGQIPEQKLPLEATPRLLTRREFFKDIILGTVTAASIAALESCQKKPVPEEDKTEQEPIREERLAAFQNILTAYNKAEEEEKSLGTLYQRDRE